MKAEKLLCLILAAICCLSLFSCKKEEPIVSETETRETQVTTEETETDHEIDLIENEIMGEVDSWRGDSEEGKLTDGACYDTVFITSAKDLDPYRAYLSGFSAEDEARILADSKGKCLLIEMTGDSEHTLYSTTSILQLNDGIHIFINKTESEEETLPFHTYFLFYFSSELYQGEEIFVNF